MRWSRRGKAREGTRQAECRAKVPGAARTLYLSRVHLSRDGDVGDGTCATSLDVVRGERLVELLVDTHGCRGKAKRVRIETRWAVCLRVEMNGVEGQGMPESNRHLQIAVRPVARRNVFGSPTALSTHRRALAPNPGPHLQQSETAYPHTLSFPSLKSTLPLNDDPNRQSGRRIN